MSPSSPLQFFESISGQQRNDLTGDFATGKVLGMDIATRDSGRKQLATFIGEMTQAEFARRIQCSESHLSLILSGERGMSFRLAKRVSQETGIPIEDLPHEAD